MSDTRSSLSVGSELPLPSSIGAALAWSKTILMTTSTTPELDGQVFLAKCLAKDRSFLFGFSDQLLTAECADTFQQLVQRRHAGEPVAYILAEQEFWSLPLKVTPATLIPRPETECLVEQALQLPLPEKAQILDLGTGSGAIALALASERPHWRVNASDNSRDALLVAEENAAQLNIKNINFILSDWLEQIEYQSFDLIVSNPPYIAADDPHLNQGDLRFEPQSALVAPESGLGDYEIIIQDARAYLRPAAYLLLEHGYEQSAPLVKMLQTAGFENVQVYTDYGGVNRGVIGQLPSSDRRR